MYVLIIGAGAIGSYVGGKLALAGHRTTLVGRPALVEAVRTRGLRIHESRRTSEVRGISAVPSVAEAFSAGQTYDLACLTVKSYDTNAAAQELGALASSPLPLLTLQNGVGNEEALVARLGSESVVSGIITSSVEVVASGHVEVARQGSIGLAAVQPGGSLHRADTALSHAGFEVRLYEDHRALKWSKLLMNMIGNATSAILDWPPARVFAERRLCMLERQAVREALQVMGSLGVAPVRVGRYPLPFLAPVLGYAPLAILQPLLQRAVGSARGGKMPSLHMDLSRGRGRSEVEVLNGAITRAGEAQGVKTPVNRTLQQVLLHLARGNLSWDDIRGRPEWLIEQAIRAGASLRL